MRIFRGKLELVPVTLVVGFVYFLAGAFWGHFFRIGTPHGDLPHGIEQWMAVITANLAWFLGLTLCLGIAVGIMLLAVRLAVELFRLGDQPKAKLFPIVWAIQHFVEAIFRRTTGIVRMWGRSREQHGH